MVGFPYISPLSIVGGSGPSIEIDAFPTEGSSNAVSSGGTYAELQNKQSTLTAGTNITIVNNVISAVIPRASADQINSLF